MGSPCLPPVVTNPNLLVRPSLRYVKDVFAVWPSDLHLTASWSNLSHPPTTQITVELEVDNRLPLLDTKRKQQEEA